MGFGSAPPEESVFEGRKPAGALGDPSAAEGASREQGWDRSFVKAFERLQETVVGAQLFEKARAQLGVEDPRELFIPAQQSRTDAVLVRDFDAKTGLETRKRKVKIYLKTGQRLQDLVMDMAHELTHAVAHPSWDPYDPTLTPTKYIRLSIEGEGGEAAALLNECTVGLELFRAETSSLRRCQKYLETEGARPRSQLNRAAIVRDFYRVGRWHGFLERDLRKQADAKDLLALLSSEDAVVYSSTGRAPYPVALLREHTSLTRVACENTRQRLRGRAPASRPLRTESSREDSLQVFLQSRCSSEQQNSGSRGGSVATSQGQTLNRE